MGAANPESALPVRRSFVRAGPARRESWNAGRGNGIELNQSVRSLGTDPRSGALRGVLRRPSEPTRHTEPDD